MTDITTIQVIAWFAFGGLCSLALLALLCRAAWCSLMAHVANRKRRTKHVEGVDLEYPLWVRCAPRCEREHRELVGRGERGLR